MLLPPSVVEQMLLEPNTIDFFRGLEFLFYSGDPFNLKTGDQLSKVVELVSPYGSTETLVLPELAVAREDWEWHEFSPYLKHEMRSFDPTEGTYELVLFSDETTKDTAAIYHTLPGVAEYRTKDLFTRHPEKPRLYKYYGRSDDIVVFANNEKFNPIPLELNVQNHPSLKGALMVGHGRTQAAIIVEPKESLDEPARAKLLEAIWPSIESSNALIAGPGRIHHGMVICASPDRPFTRTGKGTVVRKLTEETYNNDIDRLYSGLTSDDKTVCVSLKPISKLLYERSAVVDFLRTILAVSFTEGGTIGEDEDFYAYGLDSIQTLSIVSNLRRNLQDKTSAPVNWIAPRTIFQNSTINDLSRLVENVINTGQVDEADSDLARVRIADDTVRMYLESLPGKPPSPRISNPSKTHTVALIGSTGYLGSYILLQLLKDPNVSRIYCLNRGDDAQERQSTALRNLDNSVSTFLHKLAYMKVELGQPLLGLAKDNYNAIGKEVNVIVYNSWRLDFGLAIRPFSLFLRATRDLVDLSASSEKNMRIIFISSVSSVAALASKTTAPEALIEDPLASVKNGYGQSKLAAEIILAAAAGHSGIPVSVVRICQIGGPTSSAGGPWPDQPWISALLRTSKTLKCMPDRIASIDWVPVDTVAAMLHAFILQPAQNHIRFYNICHPNPQPWALLIRVAGDVLGVRDTVSLEEWTRRLKDIVDPTADDIARMPALKLLDYYETLGGGAEDAAFATDSTMRSCEVMVPVVDGAMLERWLRSWDL